MRKISLIILLLSLVITSCKEKATSKINQTNLEYARERDEHISLGFPTMEFDTTEYDFGTITEGEKVSGVFNITNNGKVDLILSSVKASCGCTAPDWTKDPITPGESGMVRFEFNSSGRVGKQNKSITIKSNAEEMSKVVRIKGNVTAKS